MTAGELPHFDPAKDTDLTAQLDLPGPYARQIARAVVDELGGAMIGATWPGYLREAIDTLGGRDYIQRQPLHLAGPYMLSAEWHWHGDGSVTLTMHDWQNQRFWTGTFHLAQPG